MTHTLLNCFLQNLSTSWSFSTSQRRTPLTFSTFGSQFKVGVSFSTCEDRVLDAELALGVDICDMKEDQLGGSQRVSSRRVINELLRHLICGSCSPYQCENLTLHERN